MRVTIVGCAGSVPGPESACSCYLVEQGGFRLLLDLGAAAGPLQRFVHPAGAGAVILSRLRRSPHARSSSPTPGSA